MVFFISGFMNSQSITGDLSDILKYTNFVLGVFSILSNSVNIFTLIHKKGRRMAISAHSVDSQ